MSYEFIRDYDTELYDAMKNELQRQRDHIELIASENFTSRAVMQAMGSHLTNKYAEGYPGARYYGGCEYVDVVEQLAIDRAKALFGAEHANVQPHSGFAGKCGGIPCAFKARRHHPWHGSQSRRSPDPRLESLHFRQIL